MRIKFLTLMALTVLMAWSCSPEKKETEPMNPFFEVYDTPFGVPPFHLIKNEHFKPAIEEGIAQEKAKINAIAESEEPATFANTIEAMENTGDLLTRVSYVFGNLNSAHTNDSIQAIAKEVAPALSNHSDDIYLNASLFARVKKIWDEQETLDLNPEQKKLLEKSYKAFVRSGANLNDDQKAILRNINQELSVLTLQFGQNILAETNDFKLIVEKQEDLAGLPAELIESAAGTAKSEGHEGKWIFTLQNPSVMPFLQYADNRELRKQIWEAYMKRGDNNNDRDNKDILKKMTLLRMQRAQLLGYPTHAHFVHEESMAKTPENVNDLLQSLWTPALKVAKQEAADMQKMIDEEGGGFELEPWDWRYYAEKIRKERFDLDDNELKPYFSLDNVIKGVFTVTEKLFGLTFKKLEDVPVYHEEVTVYEVFNENNEHQGILYMDFHPRASKRGGAWMTSYRKQAMEDGNRVPPIISIVCNFSKPSGNAPALLTFDEVTTLFHEFGHALHGLLSNVNYKSLSGTSVPRDFVELPSQIMENWASEPEVMKMYALHYETGEVIPDALIEKIEKSGTFNQGFATVEYLAASLLDHDYHTIQKPIEQDVTSFENASMNNIGLIDEIIPRYRSTYFNHIFAGGYSAGYYSYIWSGVLDSDAFQAFKETSLFDATTAKSFKENILEKGGTGDPMEMYVKFRGAEPNIDPLLRKRGLK
ncbi:MAG: M3 family metallopeptidase [Cyclobacteriaceae bacterium]